jgi:hypothetical protein
MKQLFTFIFFTFISVLSYSQSIPVNVYVINQNGCPYSVTSTWSNPILGAGNGNVVSVDSLAGQEVWHFSIPDTSNSTLFTVCVVPAPPCNCPLVCAGPMPIYPNISITLALCQNVGVDEVENINHKKILNVTDVLGRESEMVQNKLLIIHYSDGSIKKVFIKE